MSKDLELERLTLELVSKQDLILELRRKLGTMDDLEASGKLKDRKITRLEQERIETADVESEKIIYLEAILKQKAEVISGLQTSLRRQENAMVKIQQDFSDLRQQYASLRLDGQAATATTQQIVEESGIAPNSASSERIAPEESKIQEAQDFLKTEKIDMRDPMLQAQRAVLESKRPDSEKKR